MFLNYSFITFSLLLEDVKIINISIISIILIDTIHIIYIDIIHISMNIILISNFNHIPNIIITTSIYTIAKPNIRRTMENILNILTYFSILPIFPILTILPVFPIFPTILRKVRRWWLLSIMLIMMNIIMIHIFWTILLSNLPIFINIIIINHWWWIHIYWYIMIHCLYTVTWTLIYVFVHCHVLRAVQILMMTMGNGDWTVYEWNLWRVSLLLNWLFNSIVIIFILVLWWFVSENVILLIPYFLYNSSISIICICSFSILSIKPTCFSFFNCVILI